MKDHRFYQPSRSSNALRWRLGRSSVFALTLCFCFGVSSAEAQNAPPGPKAPPGPGSEAENSRSGEFRSNTAPQGDDTMTRNAAARTRMLECGHQWSAKKKAGTASGTWKEFFKTCLTHQ